MNQPCYIVFGPPGAGKSTLLRYLPRIGTCLAVDLENIGGKENYDLPEPAQSERNKRKAFLRELIKTDFRAPLFIGIADIDPRDFPPQCQIIFLDHPNLDQYLTWADRRDRTRPEKAGQDYRGMYVHLKRFKETSKCHFIIRPSEFDGLAEQMATHIWHLIGLPMKQQEVAH